MLRDTQVFTPNDFPEHSYVVRKGDNLEVRVRDALAIPKQPISISGPSKSGKTALVERVVGPENLIKVSGIEVRKAEDLWERVLDWMDTPNAVSSSLSTSDSNGSRASVQIPVGRGASVSFEKNNSLTDGASSTLTRNRAGLAQVHREIADSDFVVFLDDFHYMPGEIQADVARQIKAAAERDIKICIASVPHRSDDVVRSNHELRGRTLNIDTRFWDVEDLVQIGQLGFPKLNMVIDEADLRRLAIQACGSPQLMQSICLDVCRKFNVRTTALGVHQFPIPEHTLREILEDTSLRTDYSSLVRDLHQGPRTKGQPRDRFQFVDGSTGDVYRSVLMAIRRDPPHFQIPYAELIERVNETCNGRAPISASIQNACRHMTKIAEGHSPAQRILEWDDRAGSGTLSVVDPYFLFFLRHSTKLQDLVAL
jgi:hypothetical protein